MMCDVKKIQQVVSNLIVNSINYGNKDGHTRIKFFDMGEKVLIEVSDNGIGIKEKDLMRIYERFYRVDKVVQKYGWIRFRIGYCKTYNRNMVKISMFDQPSEKVPHSTLLFRKLIQLLIT